jgi:hypothetical protein
VRQPARARPADPALLSRVLSPEDLFVSGPSAGGSRLEIRAPRQDGAILAVPPLDRTGALLAANHDHLSADLQGRELLGRSWSDLRRQARREAIAAARQYLMRRGEPLPTPQPAADSETLLVAGHQPELFHPGVWVKNFALHGLARRHGGTPLNLVVDTDTIKTTTLRVPGLASSPDTPAPHPVTRFVPFDRWTGEVPYEARTIADPEEFATFAERAREVLAPWGYEPMLPAFWEEVLSQARQTPLVGECFAAARRSYERRWGCHNLEVPMSVLCDGEAFAWFACLLLAELPRFHALYNATVRDYRIEHGIRSRNHPVPDLAAEGDWLEAPLWGLDGRARRGRLFARRVADRLELRVGQDVWPALPFPEAARGVEVVAAWQGLAADGYRVRSRALTTTLYARLLLADLFLHGIGGGKYDELTDELMRRFHGIRAPAFLVLSATLWLPLPRSPVGPDDCRRLAHALRDLHHNPQRHADGLEQDEHWRELSARKQEWMARQPPPGPAGRAQRRERFAALRRLTAELRTSLRLEEQRLRQQLAGCRLALAGNAVLQRRDYSFCLYPEATLRPFCTQFLSGGAPWEEEENHGLHG